MKAKCPHCSTQIELLSTKDILDLAGVSQGTLADWREKGRFPAEWARIGKSPTWLRSDVRDFLDSWESRKSERAYEAAEKLLNDLSPGQRERAVERLQRQLIAA